MILPRVCSTVRCPPPPTRWRSAGSPQRGSGSVWETSLALEGPEEAATFRVVGIAVVPGLGINVGVGEGAVLTFARAVALPPTWPRQSPPWRWYRMLRRTRGSGSARWRRCRPGGHGAGAIRNVARVQSVPLVLSCSSPG